MKYEVVLSTVLSSISMDAILDSISKFDYTDKTQRSLFEELLCIFKGRFLALFGYKGQIAIA